MYNKDKCNRKFKSIRIKLINTESNAKSSLEILQIYFCSIIKQIIQRLCVLFTIERLKVCNTDNNGITYPINLFSLPTKNKTGIYLAARKAEMFLYFTYKLT